MAARITASAVDFAALGAKIPAAQKAAFGALQNKVATHQRKVNSLPAAMPAIDFDSYRAKITVAGMVDNFVAKFTADSNARIEGIKADLAKWEAMKPVEEMNREEALEAGLVGTVITGMVDPKVPSFWPHNETWEAYKARLDATEDEEH